MKLNLWGGIKRCTAEAINDGSCPPPGLNELARLIINIANIAILLVGTISVLFIVIGGFYYITSTGNPDNIGKAKNTILYAVIGLILAITSYGIINYITSTVQ